MLKSQYSARWQIALMVCCAIAISYFDRQTLPVAIAAIQRDIPMSNTDYSTLQSVFLIAYAVMYAGGGRLIDLVGSRTGFAAVMIWWSLACASHGLARSVGLLGISRFLLGVGEGGAFPAATKVVSSWFQPQQRATAMGIINAGTAVGAVLAPPAIAAIILNLDWHWVFFFAGLIGLLWTVWWFIAYHEPADSQIEHTESVGWLRLLSYPQVLGLVSAKFLSDAAWYFYLLDRKSTRLNSSHRCISYAVFCLKKKNKNTPTIFHVEYSNDHQIFVSFLGLFDYVVVRFLQSDFQFAHLLSTLKYPLAYLISHRT